MTIQWFSPNRKLPIITLAKYGINFNNGAVELLIGFEKIVFGCDINNKKIIIKLINDETKDGFSIPNNIGEIQNFRVSSKEFMNFLQVNWNMDLSKPVKYYLELTDKRGELMVDFKKPIIKRGN